MRDDAEKASLLQPVRLQEGGGRRFVAHIRAERAVLAPAKDTEKARALAPFMDWEARVPSAQREAFRWLLEEFRVSVFAQELGTAQPVSAQRLRTVGGL